MKKRLIPLLAGSFAALALMGVSCSKDSGDDPAPSEGDAPASIAVTPERITAPQEGGTASLAITAPAKPKFSDVPDWITVTDGTYSHYKVTVTVTVAANPAYEERTGAITVTSGSLTASVTVTQPGRTQMPDPEPASNDAVKVAEWLGFGWNMGNQLDAYNDSGEAEETLWGNKAATQATFDGLKAKGVTSVRIPVTYLNHIGPAPEYLLDSRLDRVAEVVEYAEKAGLNVIINVHHDGAENKFWLDIAGASKDAERQAEVVAEIKAVWGQIAARFQDKGDFLIFESFNEINDGGWGWSDDYQSAAGRQRQNACLSEWNQAFVDAVRAAGGRNATRYLGIPGYCADPQFTLEGLALPEDSAAGRLMVAVHYYYPNDYTTGAKYPEWGHTADASKKYVDWQGDDCGEEFMKDILSQLYARYVANNVPVYLGEFGCVNRPSERERAFQKYYLEYLCKCARTYGMAGFLWDNGVTGAGEECHAYVDHATGEYIGYAEEVFTAIKRAFFTGDASYTLQSVYDSAPE